MSGLRITQWLRAAASIVLIVLSTIGMSLLFAHAPNFPKTSTASLGEAVAAIAGFVAGAGVAGAAVSHFDLTGGGLGGSLAAGVVAAALLGLVYGFRHGVGAGVLVFIAAFVVLSAAALGPWFNRIRSSASFRE